MILMVRKQGGSPLGGSACGCRGECARAAISHSMSAGRRPQAAVLFRRINTRMDGGTERPLACDHFS